MKRNTKKYTKKQIQEAINYWTKQLKTMNESVARICSDDGVACQIYFHNPYEGGNEQWLYTAPSMKSFINHFVSTTINEADDMIIEYRNVSGQFYTNSSDFYKVIEMIRKDSLNSGKIYAKITFILDDKKDNPIKVSFDFTQAGDIDAEHIVWCPEQY